MGLDRNGVANDSWFRAALPGATPRERIEAAARADDGRVTIVAVPASIYME